MKPENYDRRYRNESDGQVFYGYDDEENGRTDWYTEDGTLDSYTDTPTDDEQEQMNDENGWWDD